MALSPPQAPYKRAAGEENFGHRHSFFTILHDFSLSRAALYTVRRDAQKSSHTHCYCCCCCCCCCAAAAAVLLLLLCCCCRCRKEAEPRLRPRPRLYRGRGHGYILRSTQVEHIRGRVAVLEPGQGHGQQSSSRRAHTHAGGRCGRGSSAHLDLASSDLLHREERRQLLAMGAGHGRLARLDGLLDAHGLGLLLDLRRPWLAAGSWPPAAAAALDSRHWRSRWELPLVADLRG